MSAKELVQFLDVPQAAPIALENLLPYTVESSGQSSIFLDNDMHAVRSLELLAQPGLETQRNSLTALINLTSNQKILQLVGKNITKFVDRIANGKSEKEPGLLCMLVTNLCHDANAVALVKNDQLTDLALKFASDLTSNYDYIAFIFAEKARQDPILVAKLLPGLYPQLLVGSESRRAGIGAAIKNCLFDTNTHEILLDKDSDLIEHIMLSLKGPEEMDPRDLAEIPECVSSQFSPDKKREANPSQQLVLVETLVLLSATKLGRDSLRDKHAYYIVRELHLASKDADVVEACERYVNQVMRGDPEISGDLNEEDDTAITEVV